MLDSSCANACALNGLPGPMRLWFTGFTHSLTHFFCEHRNRKYSIGVSGRVRHACPEGTSSQLFRQIRLELLCSPSYFDSSGSKNNMMVKGQPCLPH